MTITTTSNKSVWIVDDDPITRLLIKKTLERTGQFDSFREFADGSDLISVLENFKQPGFQEPDLVLLDINMSERDGWEVLAFIENENISFQKAQLILLTSSINPKDQARAFNYDQVDGFLNKPLTEEDLKILNL